MSRLLLRIATRTNKPLFTFTSFPSCGAAAVESSQSALSRSRVQNSSLSPPAPAVVISHHRRNFMLSHSPLRDIFTIQDDQDFKDKVTSVMDKPVVVEFFATWCGPCKMLMPRLESRISATKNKVDLAKVDIDNNPDLAMEYGVGAVPSVIVIKDGKVIDKFVGLKDEDEIDVFVKKLG